MHQLRSVQNGGPVLLCSFQQWTSSYKQEPIIMISMCTRAQTRFYQHKTAGFDIGLSEYTQKVFFTDCAKQKIYPRWHLFKFCSIFHVDASLSKISHETLQKYFKFSTSSANLSFSFHHAVLSGYKMHTFL